LIETDAFAPRWPQIRSDPCEALLSISSRLEDRYFGEPQAGPDFRACRSLTLADELGYGVVQLDVTIVNTALNAIDRRSRRVSNCNGCERLHDRLCRFI